MTAPESFAGITVPEGNPGQMRQCAAGFRTAGTGLDGVGADLRAVPGAVSDWQGPASAAFDATTYTNGTAVRAAVDAMATCEQAARDYAEVLEDAQTRARQAIADARDAQARIDRAEDDIAAAESEARTASIAIDSANSQIAIAASTGAPTDAAYAALGEATTRLDTAGTNRSNAARRLQEAQDDLRDAQERGRIAAEDARTAARAAAGAFNGVAGGSVAAAVYGGPPQAVGDQFLARVRAGDYDALDGVPLNYLPAAVQRSIGAELAEDADEAALNGDAETLSGVSSIVRDHVTDEDLANGFYNRLGGGGAQALVTSLGYLNVAPNEDGFHSDAAQDLFAPFSGLLATATAGDGLRSDFADDFFGSPEGADDRLGTHELLTAFVMSTAAGRYGPQFLSRVGREVLIDPRDPITNPDAPPHQRLSDHQDFMEYLAGNDEAAGLLLAGRHGADEDHPNGFFPNPTILLMEGHYYTDDGAALGALIEAGTHDLRTTNPDLANDAAHQVIQVTPGWIAGVPEGAHDALVTILDDHIADFQGAALERAQGEGAPRPADGITDLTYGEAESYLQALIETEGTRDPTGDVVAGRVTDELYQAAATGDRVHADGAGALAQMNVQATAGAELDDAERSDFMNGLGEKATGHLLQATPIGRVPGSGELLSPLLKEVFPQDAVKHALEDQGAAQVNALQRLHETTVAMEVQLGHLPPQALDMINENGTTSVNFIDGGSYDQDVVIGDDGKPIAVDLDRDGRISADEREVTERDLYEASRTLSGNATETMTNLWDLEKDDYDK